MVQLRRAAAVALCLVVYAAALGAQASEIVYVTKTGAKYHRAGCTSLRLSKIAMTLAAAAEIYGPCKICNPPTLVRGTPVRAESEAIARPPENTSVARTPQTSRCQATTKKGTQCLRTAKAGSKYCWQHGG
jgi:hypothetical protein